jgi:hypothetical protein
MDKLSKKDFLSELSKRNANLALLQSEAQQKATELKDKIEKTMKEDHEWVCNTLGLEKELPMTMANLAMISLKIAEMQ